MNLFMSALGCCALVSHALAQPMACKDESHCPSDYFCQTDVHFCLKCLQCNDHNRLPPEQPKSCIQSFTECGHCLSGFVEDPHGDLTAKCVEPTTLQPGSLPVYVWIAVACGLLFFILVVGMIVYALRNKEVFKSVVSRETRVNTSGPEPPPPYNEQYAPVRASSPSSPPSPDHTTPIYPPADESSWPFIKPATGGARGAAREAARAQAAQVYNNPAYVRGPTLHDPPSYESAEESEPHVPFAVIDEDTMESPWTPHENNNTNDTVAASVSASTALVRSDVAPPAKRARLPQDGNNNNGRGDSPPRSSHSAGNTPSVVVIVQQNNDLRL